MARKAMWVDLGPRDGTPLMVTNETNRVKVAVYTGGAAFTEPTSDDDPASIFQEVIYTLVSAQSEVYGQHWLLVHPKLMPGINELKNKGML